MINNEEEIPEVNESVANETGKIVSFALINDITIENIDYDVLGGSSLILTNHNFILNNPDEEEKRIWISLLNNGARTIYDIINQKTISRVIDYYLIMETLFNN